MNRQMEIMVDMAEIANDMVSAALEQEEDEVVILALEYNSLLQEFMTLGGYDIRLFSPEGSA